MSLIVWARVKVWVAVKMFAWFEHVGTEDQ
jgi:hypothetical protein